MLQPPSLCGGFQAIDRKSRLAPVTCSSRGGEGTPGGDRTDFRLFFYYVLLNDPSLITEPTCWILDGEDLCGFTRVTDAGLVLGADLELSLGSLDDVRHSVLTVWT